VKTKSQTSRSPASTEFQPLEARRMMSAVHAAAPIPLIVSTVFTSQGTELCVSGTTGDNTIVLNQVSKTQIDVKNANGWEAAYHGDFSLILITGGSGNNVIKLEPDVTIPATIRGGAGNDTIYAGNGDDELIGGPQDNILEAGSGKDTLVSIGAKAETLVGGSGFDSFWADDSAHTTLRDVTNKEEADGTVHLISSFLPTYTTVNAQVVATPTPTSAKLSTSLPEPSVDQYATAWGNYSSDPLFSSAGPSENDVIQGSVGDCYFLSTLSSVAKIDPNLIRQSVASLGDGTYAVRFFNSQGTATYVRVDAELPEYWAGSEPAYARLGAQNCLWVAIMEKAWAEFRTPGDDSYAAINAGQMSEAYTALGLSSSTTYSFASATIMAQSIQQQLAAGNSVTYATLNDTAQLLGDHAYTVDSVITNQNGNVTEIELRNPWGAQDPNSVNGYVVLTPTQLFQDMNEVAFGDLA
jgi:calpain family cysteine protease/hemolysin type calcium-binding protein